MKTIINPTAEQIAKALALAEESAAITGDSYAMTGFGTFINKGNVSTPKDCIKAVRYITVYGGHTARVANVLENIDMYPKQAIVDAGYTPIADDEISQYFENFETVIYEC